MKSLGYSINLETGGEEENEVEVLPLRHKIDFLAFFTVELMWTLYSHGITRGFSL